MAVAVDGDKTRRGRNTSTTRDASQVLERRDKAGSRRECDLEHHVMYSPTDSNPDAESMRVFLR